MNKGTAREIAPNLPEPVIASDQGLNIAYVLPAFPVPTETFAVSDVNALAQDGHRVTVYTMKPTSRAMKDLLSGYQLKKGVEVDNRFFSFGSIPAVFRQWRAVAWVIMEAARISVSDLRLGLTTLGVAFRVAAICDSISRNGFDVVHAFWGRHPSLVIGALRVAMDPPPRLSVFVGAYDLIKDDELVRLGLQAADIHFTHSLVNRAYFEERGIPDVNVIHRGIPTDKLTASSDRRIEGMIFTASALDPRKNVEGVIRAFAQAAKRRSHLTLEIAGDGSDLARLQAIAASLGVQERVKFLGHIPREEVFRIMSEAQIFLFLSNKDSERLPNVVKEALLAGCYVVASQTPGIEELLRVPAFGNIVSTDDHAAVAAVLERAFDEPDQEAAERRRAAAKWINTKWSSASAMRSYVSAWLAIDRPMTEK